MQRLHFVLIFSLIALVVVGLIFFSVTHRAAAQTESELIAYLEEKLASREVPVVSIQVHRDSFLNLSESPFRVEVTLQSASTGEKCTPEDPLNVQAVTRAVLLARGKGYPIDVLTTIVQNDQGQAIFWAEEPVRDEISPEEIPTSQFDNRATEDLVKEELDLYALTLEEIAISPNESGDQLLTIKLSAPDIETANQSILSFMPSLHKMFRAEDNFNKRHGTQITTIIVNLIDRGRGKDLLDYSLDVLTSEESWTMADELTKDWFPHPPK